MKKIWFGMVVFSMSLIYFHKQQLNKDLDPFMATSQNLQSGNGNRIIPIDLTINQKENLRKYHLLKQDSLTEIFPTIMIP